MVPSGSKWFQVVVTEEALLVRLEKPRVALIFSPSTTGLLLLVALPGPSSSANKPFPLAFVREVKSLL